MNNYFIHFQVDADTKNKIDKYTKEMNITISKLMRKFINNGLDSIYSLDEIKDLNYKIDKLDLRLRRIEKLIKQFYSDMGIDNHTNPNNNECLQKFYNSLKEDDLSD